MAPYGGYAGGSAFEQQKLGITPYNSGGSGGMFGPATMQMGLGMVQGIAGAMQSFNAARAYKGSASQLKLQANQALEQGFQAGIDIAREGGDFLGSMTASFGKSGSLLEGSPLLTLADTGQQIERNVMRAVEQGRIEYQALMREYKKKKKAAKSSVIGGVMQVVGVVAAPFTGGASLALTAAGSQMGKG